MSALGSVVGHSLDDSEVADSSSLSSRESGDFTQTAVAAGVKVPSDHSLKPLVQENTIAGRYPTRSTDNRPSPNSSLSWMSEKSEASESSKALSGSDDPQASLLSSSAKRKFPKGKDEQPRTVPRKPKAAPRERSDSSTGETSYSQLPRRSAPYVTRDEDGNRHFNTEERTPSLASQAFNQIAGSRAEARAERSGEPSTSARPNITDRTVAGFKLGWLAAKNKRLPTKDGISDALNNLIDKGGGK